MKRKLKLSDLEITSFVTSINAKTQNEIKGGTGLLETNPDIGHCAPASNLTRCYCQYDTAGPQHCELIITGPVAGC